MISDFKHPLHAPPVIIAGHSHITALGVPTRSDKLKGLMDLQHHSNRVFGFVGEPTDWPRDQHYWDALSQNCEDSIVALFWKGNSHYGQFLFESSPPFDFCWGNGQKTTAANGVQILPQTAIVAYLGKHEQYRLLRQVIADLKTRSAMVIICATPPPKKNNQFVKGKILKEQLLAEQCEKTGQSLDHIKLSNPIILYKIWRLMKQELMNIAKSTHSLFFDLPSVLTDNNMFLHPDYYGADATHAGGAYGDVYKDALMAFVEGNGL